MVNITWWLTEKAACNLHEKPNGRRGTRIGGEIRMASVTEKYQCCFCGQTITPIGPDVGGLVYTARVDRSPEGQRDQQMWCHTDCLRERLHPSINLYTADLIENPPED
jgi:hypothetical protein